MSRKSQVELLIFATKDDYEPVLRAVEAERSLKFILFGMFDTDAPPSYSSGLDIPDLGIARRGNTYDEDNYVVTDANVALTPHLVELYQGGVRYRVSQLECPTCITFQPAGLYGDRCILRGSIATVNRHPASVALYRTFAREFRRRFKRVHGYWIGPDALQRFRSGARLTWDAHLRIHDLPSEPLALPPSPEV